MATKNIKVGLVGRTNSGKSTFINSFIGEKISIENKKINTTQEAIIGIYNKNSTQIIIYDTPGLNFLKSKTINSKKFNTIIWEIINNVDLVLFIIDSANYNYELTLKDIEKIHKVKKHIVVVFNKIDLINKIFILQYINDLNDTNLVEDFFNISAKYHKGIGLLEKYLLEKSKFNEWKFKSDEITDKDDIFISNECTRNSLLKYLHMEIPYNIFVKNKIFKQINKKNIKIKQVININNQRYKKIILGKNGKTIKRIREDSQREIENILNSKIHLYIDVVLVNAK